MRGLIDPIVIDLEGDQSGLDLRYRYRDSRFLAGAGESRITQSLENRLSSGVPARMEGREWSHVRLSLK
jgi:hypothetical protein